MSKQQDAKAANRELARLCRGHAAKSILDISMLNIDANNGVIEMSGYVRAPRGQMGTINVKKEFDVIRTMIRSVRGVRDVYADRVRLME